MDTPLRVLIVEDSESDALLVVNTLESSGRDITWKRVSASGDMANALDGEQWDVVISDHGMPGFRPTRRVFKRGCCQPDFFGADGHAFGKFFFGPRKVFCDHDTGVIPRLYNDPIDQRIHWYRLARFGKHA